MTHPHAALAAGLALSSAGLFGLASALQHLEAGRVDRRAALDPSLLGELLRRRTWLLGIAADIAAVAVQAVALHFGAVALVQPVLVAGLPVAALLSARWTRRRLTGLEGLGLVLSTGGLLLLAPATATTSLGGHPGRSAATLAGVVLALATGALLLLAHRRPRVAPAATGIAAGAVTGAGSVLLAVCAGRTGDLGGLFTSFAPYAAVVVGLLGLLLAQAAFQTGSLGAPLAALSVVEPLVAVTLAVTVLHEHLPGGAGDRAAAIAGALLAVVGVLALTHRPAGSGSAGPVAGDRLLGGA